jgi:plastocyanin
LKTSTRILTTALLGLGGMGILAQTPSLDRVGFPANYRDTFTKLLTVDRSDNGQIRVIWGNSIAAANPLDEPYAYGSILLFEQYSSKMDSAGNLLLDDNGRQMPDTLAQILVQRKEVGFGEAYGANRNGEWEYVAYRPDGTFATAPENSGGCAACHLQVGSIRDYVYRRDRIAQKAAGSAPQATMSLYNFIPRSLIVKKGTMVTWYNDDEVIHQIVSSQLGFTSDRMNLGASYSVKLDQEGTFDVRCAIHPGMRSTVTVQPAN